MAAGFQPFEFQSRYSGCRLMSTCVGAPVVLLLLFFNKIKGLIIGQLQLAVHTHLTVNLIIIIIKIFNVG